MKDKLQEAAIKKIGYSEEVFDGDDWNKVEWFVKGANWQANEDKQSIDELVSALEYARRITQFMQISTEREMTEMRFDSLIQKHKTTNDK